MRLKGGFAVRCLPVFSHESATRMCCPVVCVLWEPSTPLAGNCVLHLGWMCRCAINVVCWSCWPRKNRVMLTTTTIVLFLCPDVRILVASVVSLQDGNYKSLYNVSLISSRTAGKRPIVLTVNPDHLCQDCLSANMDL